jgi:hypothetical protein
MQIEAIDVTTIDQLTDPEVDELLARAVNPRMPIEVFYAVLERIGTGRSFAVAAEAVDVNTDVTAGPTADAPMTAAAQDELEDVPEDAEV